MQLLADRTRPDVVVDHLTELTSWAFSSPPQP
jgi:hypothetical protein